MSHSSYVCATAALVLVTAAATAPSLAQVGPDAELVFRGADGTPIAIVGPGGLWRVTFEDGTPLTAADVVAEGNVTVERQDGETLHRYVHPRASVTVRVVEEEGGFALRAEVTPHATAVLELQLPAALRLGPSDATRVIVPADGNMGVGYAFDGAFFAPQPTDRPTGWASEVIGPAGYERLYGSGLVQRANEDPPVPVRVTPEGREWLGDELADRIDGSMVVANRPPAPGQADLVVLDTANGPYVSSKAIGHGGIVRVGGAVRGDDEALVSAAIVAVVRRLASQAQGATIGLISLEKGPERGGWAAVRVDMWRTALARVARDLGGTFVELESPDAMVAALGAGECAVVLNPYGEQLPVPTPAGMDAAIDAISAYVAAGGRWIEVGGYPFFYAMTPQRFLRYAMNRPAGFADFAHIEGAGASLSIYGVQPRDWAPWAAVDDPQAIFIPTRLSCGGDEQGGYVERAYVTYVLPGATWRSPATRLVMGFEPPEALRRYCSDNGITRRLEDKLPPDRLAAFRQAVLLYYGGSAAAKLENLDRLPVPTLVHFADYLKGGFDKEYPDHLPPHPGFGTQQELRELFDRCHALGHWIMPYTNPTWWCDDPKGPTFAREGDAPLLRTLAGEMGHEVYGANVGFTITHWHPAVRAANEETVRQFTQDLPVDVLFQDQCGARGFRYDTNPASPTPYAYTEGLLSMVQQDAAAVPLSTEGGWDGVVNHQIQLCGMSWALVPTEGGPDWRVFDVYRYPPSTWSIYPVAQYIAHDKCSMVYHDLGQFVTNREVLAWTLGLGFSMSNRISAPALSDPAQLGWLQWIDRIQKSVCARYIGEPVEAFVHDRGADPDAPGDDLLRARYGDVEVLANLGPTAQALDDRVLAGFGFVCRAPQLEAGNVQSLGGVDFGPEGLSYVVEGGPGAAEAWVYAETRSEVVLPIATEQPLTLETGEALNPEWADGLVRFRLPDAPGAMRKDPPAHLTDLAPIEWPAGPPKIGVLAVPGMGLTWTQATPERWLEVLSASPLARELGVEVLPIASAEDLVLALAAGPERWLTIVNPYGEAFPIPADQTAEGMLDRIREYVESGGCWWETGGFSFHSGSRTTPEGREAAPVGPAGLGRFGLEAGGGPVEQAPEPLIVTVEGREWLRQDTVDLVQASRSAVNRALPRGSRDIGHTTLVTGQAQDFIGGYRLDGWGWLWRLGGFSPDPEVATRVAADAMYHIYTYPPLPVRPSGVKRLWHIRPAGE